MKNIKSDNGNIVTNWYEKNTHSGRLLRCLPTHPYQNQVVMIKHLVVRVANLPHGLFLKVA